MSSYWFGSQTVHLTHFSLVSCYHHIICADLGLDSTRYWWVTGYNFFISYSKIRISQESEFYIRGASAEKCARGHLIDRGLDISYIQHSVTICSSQQAFWHHAVWLQLWWVHSSTCEVQWFQRCRLKCGSYVHCRAGCKLRDYRKIFWFREVCLWSVGSKKSHRKKVTPSFTYTRRNYDLQ